MRLSDAIAYYNEHDPKAAAWLRELIQAGHIAPGVVDERSIEDVRPSDLRGFAQCHFFAGIGVWSYALRLAGWDDARPVWTGSCPCQPFSAAGKGAGIADERHLWPAFHHLITQCRPPVVFGEQVASTDGLQWLDLVHADLEAAGYAVGAADLCAAGVGAPHIRQRLFFVADANERAGREGRQDVRGRADRGDAEPRAGSGGVRVPGRLAEPGGERLEGVGLRVQPGRSQQPGAEAGRGGEAGRLADTERERVRARGQGGVAGAPAALQGLDGERERVRLDVGPSHDGLGARPGPTNGPWQAADWLLCRDGKWRPVEPGTFPLAHGAPARVGRLRGYGNAIVAQVAETFIGAYLDVRAA